jgi:signal transduction histidine kinase
MTQPQYFANPYTVNKNDTLWANDTFYVNGQKPFNNVKSELTWDSVTAPYNLPVNLQVPYNKNFFQFQFAQASLSRQDTTWYSYFLQGIDRKWSAPTSNTFTENYMNLQPGNYTFKVSSKSIGGQWSVPASFSFTITPPWYSTWWAYTIFALLAIGILRVYIVYRSRRLQAENKLLEEKINLRTSQLQKSIEDLKATQSQLVQSEKMASLGELTAGIAHEIQNPLNFINNFSEINTELIDEMTQEIEKGNLDEVRAIALDLKENEQKINHHGKRADTIVKGMLQHSRSSNGAKEPTNINALADEYLRLSYHGLRAKDKSFNATFKTDFDETIGRINVVPEEIGRTILNLITNAFYAVNEKKKQLTKDSPPFEPTVTVSTRKTDGKVVIRVADNGNGISQKNIDKIFNPFFTTKPAGQGTGLGLSLSYDIVKAHGGELKVETKEGEGVVFIVELPMQNRY